MDQLSGGFTIIRYHWNYPSPYDPYYRFDSTENMARNNYYGNNYSPHLIINGNFDAEGRVDSWEDLIISQAGSSPLRMIMWGTYDSLSRTGTIVVRVVAEENPGLIMLKLRIALVESGIYWLAPNGTRWHNQTFRDMIPSTAGEPIDISYGDSADFSFNYQISNTIHAENCTFIAFVQSDLNKRILQGAKFPVNLFYPPYSLSLFSLIDPPVNSIIATATPSLIWHSSFERVSGFPIYYKAFWSTDQNFTIQDSSNDLLDTSYTIITGLNRSTRYYWQVKAFDFHAPDIFSQDIWNYYIDGYPNPPQSGFSPTNGEDVHTLLPVIRWDSASDPDSDDVLATLRYNVEISFDSSFTEIYDLDTSGFGQNHISFNTALQDSSHYFYRIKTLDDSNLSSVWSEAQDFRTINQYNPPEPFPLYAPANGFMQTGFYAFFTWGNTIDIDAFSSFTYAIDFSPDSTFHWSVGTVSNLTDTIAIVATDSLFLLGNRIFWRVKAIDNDGLIRFGGISEQIRYLYILLPGDANSSGTTNGLDVIYLVNYFKGVGPAPAPILAGDANGSCQTNGLDVTYLVGYLKGVGPPPVRGICETTKLLNLDFREIRNITEDKRLK